MKEKLEKSLREILRNLGIKNSGATLEHPMEVSNGNYSTSVALSYAKDLKTSPTQLAEKIKTELEKDKPEEVEKIEIAGPGFINFFLSQQFFTDVVSKIIKKPDQYGKTEIFHKQKTIIEYTDPNPFKEFHIGHLMSNTIGESLSRIVEYNGAEVKRANYQGDVGIHVASALWGKMKKPDAAWGEAYVLGAAAYQEDTDAEKEILELNKKIFERSDKEINKLYDAGKKQSLDSFEKIYKRLGTKFDFYFFESETGGTGRKLVEENIGEIFEKSEGAVIFKGEKYGLHTRVFINSQGLPTYEAKDLGLAKIKHDKYHYDKSIVVTGNEVNDYFRVMHKAMELLFPELAEKTIHISHGMLRLPTGKMSSRTGEVIAAESLLNEVKEKVRVKVRDRNLSDAEKEDITEKVSIGAIKYSILKQSSGKDIIYDFEKSLSFEGDSGPYLQYAHTRAVSVIHKAREEGIRAGVKNGNKELGIRNNGVGEIERLLYRFPEIIERAGREYEPHYLTTYLVDLAGVFNSFYAKEKIVDAGDVQSPYKVALTKAVAGVLKNGLYLLGIPVPDKM